jgi:XTP/dITP diphosphohydrolase
LSIFIPGFIKEKMKIVFATNNENKLIEIHDLLGDSFTLLSLKDINIMEDIPEDLPTLEGNALFKARYIHNATGMNVFADDTGLEIEALNHRPGVLSARFAGVQKNFSANTEKVLRLMKLKLNRKARFRSVIALILNESEFLFEGVVTGTILNEQRGAGGFGYDPIFVPDGENKTFAEMSLYEKNKISHRALAFAKLKLFLLQNAAPDNKAIN